MFFVMDKLKAFTLKIAGMKTGIHNFDFQVGNAFFKFFETSLIEEGNFKIDVQLDKRTSMMLLDFDYSGSVRTTCDRCLEEFTLPVNGNANFMVKFDHDEREEDLVIYIDPGRQEFNIAHLVYEILSLAIPMVKSHQMANETCSSKVEQYLNKEEAETEVKENPIWDALKNFSKEDK